MQVKQVRSQAVNSDLVIALCKLDLYADQTEFPGSSTFDSFIKLKTCKNH